MFGFCNKIEEDEDTGGNSSCPSAYQYFNGSVKPRRKIGRRRKDVPQKDEKAEDNGEQLQSQSYQQDDSGICTSGSTPSMTHPVARTGTLFSNQSKPDGNGFMSGLTPSFKPGRENKFALPHTPMRYFKSEPLKEINGMNNVVNKSVNISEPPTLPAEGSGNSLQKQLNDSFICDESLPLVTSNDSHQNSLAANKTCNETANSDDSSFMTCHDVHRPEVPGNKTFYDPEFLKTPGKNLAEIRIDESPFNPLEGFLEESDDFGDCNTKTPVLNDKNQGNPAHAFATKTNCSSLAETSKACVKSLNSGNQAKDHSQNDQMAYPLVGTEATPLGEYLIRDGAKSMVSPVLSGCEDKNNVAHLKDTVFKRPGYILGPAHKCTQKAELNLNSSDVGNTRTLEGKDCGEMVHNDDTTNVTYPQHSRGQHTQKNSFTSQFSLTPSSIMKAGLQDSGKALSLSSALSRPLSAASSTTNRGVISSSISASNNPFDKASNAGAPPANVQVGTLMNHPPNHDNNRVIGGDRRFHSRGGGADRLGHNVANSIVRESNVCPNNGVWPQKASQPISWTAV
uniref:Trafficking protein particle complex subunit 9 n=1 Tax=Lygus hesperus TaxID=30085 RepID=A0A0A9YKF1_LYGHE